MWENMNGLNTNVKLHSSCSSNCGLGCFFFFVCLVWGGGGVHGLCAALFCKFFLFYFFSLLQIPGALHKVVSDKLACLVQEKQPDVTGKWLLITFGK